MSKTIVIVASLALALGFVLTFGTTTSLAKQAGTGSIDGNSGVTGAHMERPYPGSGGLYCSPGYWKNHPEVWEAGICCIGLASDPASQCGEIDAQLRARGPGSDYVRESAQAVLSACFADPPCKDD